MAKELVIAPVAPKAPAVVVAEEGAVILGRIAPGVVVRRVDISPDPVST